VSERGLRTLTRAACTAVLLCVTLIAGRAQPSPSERTEALVQAALRGNVQSVRRLLRSGVDPNQSGHTASPLGAALGHPAVVRMLLKAGADPNAAVNTEFEDSIFMEAVRERALPSVKLMLAHGARVNQEGRYGNRALDFAVQNQDWAMIRLLKRYKALFGSRINREG
jgi:ankyrin repeat protein